MDLLLKVQKNSLRIRFTSRSDTNDNCTICRIQGGDGGNTLISLERESHEADGFSIDPEKTLNGFHEYVSLRLPSSFRRDLGGIAQLCARCQQIQKGEANDRLGHLVLCYHLFFQLINKKTSASQLKIIIPDETLAAPENEKFREIARAWF
jgi:hypothetical protein